MRGLQKRWVCGVAAALLMSAHCAGVMAHDAPVPILAPGAYVSGGIGDAYGPFIDCATLYWPIIPG